MQNLKINIKYLFLLLVAFPFPAFACTSSIYDIMLKLALWDFALFIFIVSIIVFIKFKKNKFLRLASLIIFTTIISFFIYSLLSSYLKEREYQKCIDSGGQFCNPMGLNLGC